MLTDDGAQKTQTTCIGSILEESEYYKKRSCKRFYEMSNFFLLFRSGEILCSEN